MKFTVMERIKLMQLLPSHQGNFLTLNIVNDLMRQLSFSEEEHAKLQFKTDGNRTEWSPEGAKELGDKEIEIGEKANEILYKELKKINDEQRLTYEYFMLYKRFVIDGKKPEEKKEAGLDLDPNKTYELKEIKNGNSDDNTHA